MILMAKLVSFQFSRVFLRFMLARRVWAILKQIYKKSIISLLHVEN